MHGNSYKDQLKEIKKSISDKNNENNITYIKKFKYIILVLLFAVFTIVSYYFNILPINCIKIIGCGFAIIFALVMFLDLFIYNKKRRKIQNDISVLENKKKSLESEILKINNDIDDIRYKIQTKKNLLLNKLEHEYYTNFSIDELNNFFNLQFVDIMYKITIQEKHINDKKFELEKIRIEENNFILNNDKLNFCEIDLQNCFNEKQELLSFKNSILLAKDALEKAYNETKLHITPNLQENLNKSAKIIFGNLYKNIFFNENDGVIVELPNGRIVPIEQLSYGTIEQIYLILRLNILSDANIENLPIILDEPFVYYDDNRLENTLLYLDQKYNNKQIIIFSCSNREYDVLNGLDIKYNNISI